MPYSFVARNSAVGNVATISFAHGLTLAAGQLLFLYVNNNAEVNMALPQGGADWVELLQEKPSGESAMHALFAKVTNGSEPLNYTINQNAVVDYHVEIRQYSVTGGTPRLKLAAVSSLNSSDVYDAICDAMIGRAVSAGDLSVIFGGKDRGVSGKTWLGVDQGFEEIGGSGESHELVAAHKIHTVGETLSNPVTFTSSVTSGTTDDLTYNIHAVYDIDVGDIVAPTFETAPAAANATGSGHTITATLNESGTLYAVRLPDGAAAPTAAQVRAGQDSTGSAAPEAKSVAATASVEASMVFNTGSASTDYDYYVVGEDDEGTPNLQASPVLVNATTSAPTPAVTAITPCRLGEPFTVTVEHFDLTTADTLELRIDGTAITGPASFTATTATFNMPPGGFQIKSGAVFVLRITAGAVDIDIPIGPALSQVPTGDQAYTFGKPVVASNGDWLLLGTAGSDHVSADNRLVLMESPSGLNQGQDWTNPVDIFKDHTDDASFESSTRQFILFREPETGDIISITGTLKTNFNPFTEGYHRIHSHRRASGGTTWVTTEITSQIPDATFGNDKMIAHGSVVETVNGLAMCVYAGDEVKILFSTDQANTWGNAVTVGDAPKGTHNLTATEPELLALTPSKLVLVCRHNENAGTKAYMTSNDGGITWSNRSAYTTVGESGCTVDQPVAMKLIGDYVYFAFPCRLPTGKLITNIVHKDDVDANPAELWNPSSPNRQTPYSSNTLDSQSAEGNTQAYIDFGNAYIADIPGNPGEALITFFDHAPYPENPVHTVQLNVGTFPDLVS